MLGSRWADENVRMTMSLQVGAEKEKAWRCSVEAKQLEPQMEGNERQRPVTVWKYPLHTEARLRFESSERKASLQWKMPIELSVSSP